MVKNLCLRFLALLSFAAIFAFPSLATAKALVLVPGYFSSAVPGSPQAGWAKPYWSTDIVNVYKKAGFRVFVVNNLNPVGTIEENGELLIEYMKSVQSQLTSGETLQILAHSAGGLYVLYATNKITFPILRMITVDTPFDGVEFIGELNSDFPGLETIEKDLNLQSLNQLRPNLVKSFMGTLSRSPNYPIIAYRGYQAKGLDIFSAANLSPVFYFTEAFMSGPSDGIVTNSSALSRAGLPGASRLGDYIHLDHWKQVMDADYFTIFGMINTSYVRKEQIRFYTNLLSEMQ